MKTAILALALTARTCEAGGSHSSGGWQNGKDAYADTGSCYSGGVYSCALDQQACTLQSASSMWLDHSTTKTCDIRSSCATEADLNVNVDVVQYNAPITKAITNSNQAWETYSCTGHGFTTDGSTAATPVLTATQCSGSSGVCIISSKTNPVTADTMVNDATFSDDAQADCSGDSGYSSAKTWLAFAGAVTYAGKNQVTLVDATGVVVNMAVKHSLIPDNAFVASVVGNVVSLKTITSGQPTNGYQSIVAAETTSAIQASDTIKFYPTEVVKATVAKFGSCKADSGGAFTGAYSNVCPSGSTFYAHDETGGASTVATTATIPIGYCYSSDCKGPQTQVASGSPDAKLDIPGGGFCALSAAACDFNVAGSTACDHGVTLASGPAWTKTLTQAQCETYDGVCVQITSLAFLHNQATVTDDDKSTCDTAGTTTWVDFPNVPDGSTGSAQNIYTNVAAWTTTQSFKPVGDSDNPGCFLKDLTGQPACGTGAASTPDTAASTRCTTAAAACPATTDAAAECPAPAPAPAASSAASTPAIAALAALGVSATFLGAVVA